MWSYYLQLLWVLHHIAHCCTFFLSSWIRVDWPHLFQKPCSKCCRWFHIFSRFSKLSWMAASSVRWCSLGIGYHLACSSNHRIIGRSQDFDILEVDLLSFGRSRTKSLRSENQLVDLSVWAHQILGLREFILPSSPCSVVSIITTGP